MLKRVLLVLLLIPLLDGLLLIVVADLLGWPMTILLVVLTALVGSLLVHAEGRRTIFRFQTALKAGRAPTDELLDGGFLIAAGALLLTPGLVTDAIGFLFVLPPTRYVIRTILKRWILVPYLDKQTGGFVTGNVYTTGFPGKQGPDSHSSQPIDLDDDAVHVEDDPDRPPKRNS